MVAASSRNSRLTCRKSERGGRQRSKTLARQQERASRRARQFVHLSARRAYARIAARYPTPRSQRRHGRLGASFTRTGPSPDSMRFLLPYEWLLDECDFVFLLLTHPPVSCVLSKLSYVVIFFFEIRCLYSWLLRLASYLRAPSEQRQSLITPPEARSRA